MINVKLNLILNQIVQANASSNIYVPQNFLIFFTEKRTIRKLSNYAVCLRIKQLKLIFHLQYALENNVLKNLK